MVPSGSTGTGTDRDQLAIKQVVGTGRHCYLLETRDEAQGPGGDKAILTLKSLVTATPLHGTSIMSELFKAATSEDRNASAPPPSTARQVRVHRSQDKIHRLMPSNGIIDFDVDSDSFINARNKKLSAKPRTVNSVIRAARKVAKTFKRKKVGITFAYAPDSDRKVFRICYDPELPDDVLAEAFFPSDPRELWQLRISRFALKKSFFEKDPRRLEKILAHEFMHILGFRHWDAGSNEDEKSEKIPGTKDNNPVTIMYTSLDGISWFSEEDLLALHWFYFQHNETPVGGAKITDLDPHDGR